MDEKWRIDALDARGGLAFAAQRRPLPQSTLTSPGDPEESAWAIDEPCIYISPPDFSPSIVPNRAIALAAGRGCFQVGLFVGDEEVAFESPRAVAEFVRRAYLSGGAGDGTDGGGRNDGPPPLPEDGEPTPQMPSPNQPLQDDSPAKKIFNAVLAFRSAGEELSNLQIGASKEFQEWPLSLTESAASSKLDDQVISLLASGMQQLIIEAVYRLPTKNDDEALLVWQASASTVRSLGDRAGLAPLVWGGARGDFLLRLIGELLHGQLPIAAFEACRDLDINDIEAAPLLTWLLFFSGAPLGDYHACKHLISNRRALRFWYSLGPPVRSARRDVIADLRRIPLPRSFKWVVPQDAQRDAGLYHALAAFLGDPNVSIHMPGFLDVMMFAATAIVSASSPVSSVDEASTLDPFYGPYWPTSPHRKMIATIANAAWMWLREQMPSAVFASALENVISDAATLRYR